MRRLSWEEFAGAEGTVYRVESEGIESVEMTLERAVELPSSGREGGSFRLEFRGPFEPILPQGIYEFHGGETLDEIFIVPVGRGDSGTLYEAVFY
jgi:hypothetical protein